MSFEPNGRPAPGGFGRRTFLKAAAGAAALLVADRAFEVDAQAQQAAGYQYFNRADAEILEALAERIWPADDQDPGAREAGAVAYIDRALGGGYAGYRPAYRSLLSDLRERIDEVYDRPVNELEGEQLDALLTELEEREARGAFGVEGPAAGLPRGDVPNAAGVAARQLELGLGPGSAFAMFRRHVMEGVLSDPVHGGNRDFAGWRALNYPGAHYVYTAEEQQVMEPLEKPIQSVADL